MIDYGNQKHHWNYFLAIEKDLEKISRYIEFSDSNSNTYSIELAHMLLSASSEVDVVLKLFCKLIEPTKTPENINEYRAIITNLFPEFSQEEIHIPRYGMKFKPWENWSTDTNPNWWKSYNNVKHERDSHFNEANLKNTINAIGALLLTIVYFYKISMSIDKNRNVDIGVVLNHLLPESNFLSTSYSRINVTFTS